MYNFGHSTAMASRDERKFAILDATLRVIADGGVDAVRARRVAAEASVPLGSVSYWFDSRTALIRGAFTHFLEINTRFMEGLLEQHPVGCADDLVQLMVAMVEQEFADRTRVLAEYELILAAGRDQALAEAFEAWEARPRAELAALLAALGSPSPDDDARTLIEFVRGHELVTLTRSAPDLDDLARRLGALLDALLARQRTTP